MLKLFKQYKYLMFCSLCGSTRNIDVVESGVTLLSHPAHIQYSSSSSRGVLGGV